MAQPSLHGPSKLVKGSPRAAHSKAPKSGAKGYVSAISLHQKHNKGVKQPYVSAGK